ncbi:hypothetical protein FOZ61_007269 [Perkinsus olseni]|uniref:HD/PDEase domain-containing protein n=1 Tax=Perkinsus olseni TaxID=32597 RepID=A0A7J6LJP8_PEROL|nr:hypothetical protein FOZ61_007269 [Perkinsus olseni]KAF4659111.1 hypothetical protein FOL46_006721 [Perkinsus olseni]
MTIQQLTGRQGVTDEQLTMIKQQVSVWMSNYDASHDMAHIERVVATTKAIHGRDEIAVGADRNLLLAVAYLHDSFDRKYCPDTTMKAQEIVKSLSEEPIGLSKSTAQFIIDKIHNMSYSAELKSGRSAESAADPYIAIVQDADRLDAMGAIGICRCMAYSGAKDRPIVSEGGAEELQLQRRFVERPESTKPTATQYAKGSPSAVAHFYEKLLQLKDTMKTRTGGQIAEQRHQFMLQFLDQIFAEINGTA